MSKPLLVIGNKNYSSWSLRGWLSLKHAGIDFEEVRIPLYTPGYRDKIREHNPAGKVPLFKVDGLAIWDSLAIAEYAAEQNPSMWPSDPQARARARSVSAEMHSSFLPLRSALPMNCRARGRKVAVSDEVAQDLDRIREIWRSCREQFGQGGPWLFGNYSIADAMFAPVVMRFLTYGVPTDEVQRQYMETAQSSPHLRHWLQAAEAETEVIENYEVGR